jgi:hypothetical protein
MMMEYIEIVNSVHYSVLIVHHLIIVKVVYKIELVKIVIVLQIGLINRDNVNNVISNVKNAIIQIFV